MAGARRREQRGSWRNLGKSGLLFEDININDVLLNRDQGERLRRLSIYRIHVAILAIVVIIIVVVVVVAALISIVDWNLPSGVDGVA